MASRIVVIGSSCSGKTTLAKKLSRNLKINHIELDEWYIGNPIVGKSGKMMISGNWLLKRYESEESQC